MNKADLIIHPVRFKILRLLDREDLTTAEIGQILEDVPNSSIYRHLKLLLDGGMIEVTETRLIKGIQEKTYRLMRPAVLDQGDIAAWNADDHLHYFTTYVLTLISDFERYTRHTEEKEGYIDMLSDRVGYREVEIWASKQELDRAIGEMSKAVQPLLDSKAGGNRRRYKLSTILHPQEK